MPSWAIYGRAQRLGGGPPSTTSPFDAATLAWVAAVIANGGSVSVARETLVDTLIVGLKSDGIFSKLDRLWLFAGENAASALTDIVAGSLATAVNSPTFTIDQGFAGNASSMAIDSNYNLVSGGGHYLQDSACLFAWDNNPTPPSAVAAIAGAGVAGNCRIVQQLAGSTFWGINRAQQSVANSASGFFLMNRTASTVSTLDVNGSQIDSNASASSAPPNADAMALTDSVAYSSDQVSCFGFGSGLSAGDRTNLYTRLGTYRTAVGLL